MDFTSDLDEGILSFVMIKLKVSRTAVKEAYQKIISLKDHLEEIDGIIAARSEGYKFTRITSVEKNILRLAIFEIFYDKVPVKVIIAESIRLCKKFSAPEGAKFINAVLDAEYKKVLDSEEQVTV